MHVRVRHLAPVRCVPARGRHERLVLAPCETEASIPAAHPDEFVPLKVGTHMCEGFLRSGEVWTDLPVSRTAGRHPNQPRIFAEWLSGRETGGIEETAIRNSLDRSPLAPAAHSIMYGRQVVNGDLPRAAVDGAREIRRDLRAACADGVRNALETGFAIVGGKVMRRANPLIQVFPMSSERPLFQLTLQPNGWMGAMLMFGIGRIHLARRHYGLDDASGCLYLDRLLEGTSGLPPPSDDRSNFVNGYAETAYEAVSAALRKWPDEPIVRLHQARLQPLADMALCGLVDAAAAPDAVGTIRAAALDVSPFLPRGWKDGFLKEIAGFADSVLTPPQGLDPGDVEVLNRLAPR